MNKIRDALEESLTAEETGITIRWNRITGVFHLDYLGPPGLHVSSVINLFKDVMKYFSQCVDAEGYIISTKHDDSKNFTPPTEIN